jgi:Ca2+-binding RTX toxin-like protein
VLWGQDGADTQTGAGGADQLSGENGNDSLDGGNGADSLFAGFDDDLLKGGAHNDYLAGDAGADRLEGGAGLDYLWGGDGADTVTGGYGGGDTLNGGLDADRFLFLNADVGPGWVETWIFDFLTTEGDEINFANIDANADKAGNQAFKVVGTLTKAGQMTMTYDSGANSTRIEGQLDSDPAVDFALVVLGDVTGGAGIVL